MPPNADNAVAARTPMIELAKTRIATPLGGGRTQPSIPQSRDA
jgi:hypothetical protein